MKRPPPVANDLATGNDLPSIIYMEEVLKLLLLISCWTCWLNGSDLFDRFALNTCNCCLVQDLGRRLIALLDSDLELWT